MAELAEALGDLSFEVSEPELLSVASWTSRGLTAYDAAYVALAERRELALVADDDTIIELAPGISRALLGGSASAGRGSPARGSKSDNATPPGGRHVTVLPADEPMH